MATSEYGEEGGDEESVVLPSTVSGSWLTPLRMLVLFCTLNILIYMDRQAWRGARAAPHHVLTV